MAHTTHTPTNPYGIADTVYQQIQNEARQQIMVEQMYEFYDKFNKEWAEYKKKIDKMHQYLLNEDKDGNGISDFLEQMQKTSDVAKAGIEMQKMLSEGSFK